MRDVKVLNTADAAKALGLTTAILRGMRNLGIGPEYIKMFIGRESGTPAIGYLESDLLAWIEAQKVKPKDEIKQRWLGDSGSSPEDNSRE